MQVLYNQKIHIETRNSLLKILEYLYNSLVQLRNRVENAWSQIDVQLKRRADLVPNLVETIKGYAKHEKTVLEMLQGLEAL